MSIDDRRIEARRSLSIPLLRVQPRFPFEHQDTLSVVSKPFIETPSAALWYHADSGIVHHEIKQNISGQPFRELLDEGYKLLLKHRATKWLSDDRHMGTLPAEDEIWSKENWFPRVVRAGWKHWAIVKPAKALAQMGVRRYADDAKIGDVTARMFDNPIDAMKWLQRV